jgi:hypothetical protein
MLTEVKDADVERCEFLRALVKAVAESVAETRKDGFYNTGPGIGEATANLMLAYRHLEDASMRLGKAVQALDGGVSVYDKSTAVMS